ncbi:alpha/beta fold hydrolase [Companilactobacillus hulinensis]|uniref:alpha/beta fold hydrolase n=1 Tax=Companilactobacillus hulinensis TaxID=2486007 RepID=UPI000F76CF6B|nr:alpha/beta hydrolase [Companilactobacillus hulinensis]
MEEFHYINAENKLITADNGVSYLYRELGKRTGIPIIGFNHLSANLDNWDPVIIDGVAKEHWIITFDYQGVGGSTGKVQDTIQGMAKDALNFIKALGFTKVNILGFSMGGMVAQELMLLDPEIINRVILSGTGPRGGEGIENVTKISDASLIKALLTFKDIKEYMFFTTTPNGKKSGKDFISRLKIRKNDRDKTINWFAYRRQLRAINKWGKEAPANLSVIDKPVLVVNGDHDIMVPTEPNTCILNREIPNSKLIIYPDAGHGSIAQNNISFVASADEFYTE